MANFFRKYKKYRHHKQGHMMMPTRPIAHLAIRHTTLVFRILGCSLCSATAALHPGHLFKIHIVYKIGKRDLCVRDDALDLRYYHRPFFHIRTFAHPICNQLRGLQEP
jgi:hypothetical protein